MEVEGAQEVGDRPWFQTTNIEITIIHQHSNKHGLILHRFIVSGLKLGTSAIDSCDI